MMWLPAYQKQTNKQTNKQNEKEKGESARTPSLLPPLPPRLPLRAWRPRAPAFVDAIGRGPEGGYPPTVHDLDFGRHRWLGGLLAGLPASLALHGRPTFGLLRRGR